MQNLIKEIFVKNRLKFKEFYSGAYTAVEYEVSKNDGDIHTIKVSKNIVYMDGVDLTGYTKEELETYIVNITLGN